MDDHAPTAGRTPPEHVNRTTRRGADQYVLACNARRDAGDITFSNLEPREREIQRLRSDVTWKREHASTRTGNWVRSRVIILMCVFAGIAATAGWMFTPNGRYARIGMVRGYGGAFHAPPADLWKTTHFITSDMTQHEIDSLAAMMALGARQVK